MGWKSLETLLLFVTIGLVAWLDLVTGREISLGLAYLLPVVAVAVRIGFTAGVTAAFAAGLCWFGADLHFRGPDHLGLSAWNGGTRLVMFALIAGLIARSRGREAEAERRYRELFAAMNDGVALHEILLDSDGTPRDYRFLAVNPAFARLTGLDAGAVVGRTVKEVLPDLEDFWIERYGSVALTGEPAHFEGHAASLGRTFEVTAFRTDPGRFATLFRDISAERLLQRQLYQAQKMEAVGRLAGGVAHDFNNILTTILSSVQLLGMDHGPDHPDNELLDEISGAAKRATALTRQLLTFARHGPQEPEVVDLGRLVADMERMLQRLVGEDIRITRLSRASSPRVLADPSRLEQVIMNLAVNARDAMPEGGRLSLEIDEVELDAAYAQVHVEVEPGPFVLLTVSDTGTGMDRDTLAHIFEPFFTTKAKGKGTGLGLSTVYGIVKQSGGTIGVYSEHGVGTVFRVYLPRAESAPGTAPGAAAPPTELRGTETILVVEDADQVRSVVRAALEGFGYRVLLAADGAEAQEVVATSDAPPDLVLCDVVLPGRPGPEVAARLRALHPGVRVVFTSGYSPDVLAERARLEGSAAFLRKPFTPDELGRTVRQALDAPLPDDPGAPRDPPT